MVGTSERNPESSEELFELCVIRRSQSAEYFLRQQRRSWCSVGFFQEATELLPPPLCSTAGRVNAGSEGSFFPSSFLKLEKALPAGFSAELRALAPHSTHSLLSFLELDMRESREQIPQSCFSNLPPPSSPWCPNTHGATTQLK